MYNKVKKIISPVYQVGGSVRDEYLGVEPKDFDFCTPLSPDEIENRIKASVNEHGDNRKCYNVGKKFGTLGVKVDGKLVEITTFRHEKYYPGNRKPKVEFVGDITMDLSRRDFTINAIAKQGDHYYDPFEGRVDILTKKIRCVGNPRHRFKEDPLRMLRAARFASQLEFRVDEELLKEAIRMSFKIMEVSKERWVTELDKLLLTDKPSVGLEFLIESRLMNYIIPELSLQPGYDQRSPWHKLELWEHTKVVVDAVPKDINLRWSALLHDIAKPFVRTNKPDRSNYIHHDLLGREMVERLALYLRWSTERKEFVKRIVETHMRDENPLRPYDFLGKKEH